MYHRFAKFIRGKAFSFLFFFIVLLSMFYVSVKIDELLAMTSLIDVGETVFFILFLFFFYMLVYINSKKTQKKTRKLFAACNVVLCILLNFMLCFLGFDFLNLFFRFKIQTFCWIPLILSFTLSVYGFLHAKKIKITPYQIHIGTHQKHIKIALLSDIHIGIFVNGKQLEKIISAVNELNADFILIAGDTFDQDAFLHCNLPEIEQALKKLHPQKQIYAVLGNHDPLSSNENMRQFFKTIGIHLLIDEIIETEDFILIGRDDVTANTNRKSFPCLLETVNNTKLKILIDHNPSGIEDGVRGNVNLILCGHTHQGQFFPATLFTKLAYGKRGFYGHSKTGTTHSIVSSGAGYFQMPMRIGTNSEIVSIDLEL